MTDIEGFLTIYGHSDNLLNNNVIFFGNFAFFFFAILHYKALGPHNHVQLNCNAQCEKH